MNVISTVSIFVFIFYISLGLFIFFQDTSNRTNRLFFLMSMSLGIWSFTYIFGFNAVEKESMVFWFKTASIGFIPYFALTFHFCLSITGVINKCKRAVYLIYIPVLIFIVKNITGILVYKDFYMVDNQWIFVPAEGSPWLYAYMIFFITMLVSSLMLLALWNRRAKTKREKKQSAILFVTLFITLIFSTLEELVLPMVSSYKSTGLASIYISLWMAGIAYSIIKYRMMTITPAVVSHEIIGSIEEAVILLNPSLKVELLNPSSIKKLQLYNEDVRGRGLSSLFVDHESVEALIKDMIKKTNGPQRKRMQLKTGDCAALLMNVRLTVIREKSGDVIGVLIIGSEVRGLAQIQLDFNLTDREVEVIINILTGGMYKEIANKMGIAERTVKAHMNNIFNKTGVDNRIDLLYRLREYEI